ncbi:MAG: ABC transporter permease, partial [Promethearchaeota archaeon]
FCRRIRTYLLSVFRSYRSATYDYLHSQSFHYSVVQRQQIPVNPEAIIPVKSFVDTRATTESSHIVYWSIGIINPEGVISTDIYQPWPYLDNPAYPPRVNRKDCSTLFVDDTFLAAAEQSFNFTGANQVGEDRILVSREVVNDALFYFGLPIGIGDRITLAVARNYDGPQVGTMENPLLYGHLDTFLLENLEVAGIYDIEPRNDIMQQAFPQMGRQNFGPFSGVETIFGWIDGIILHQDLLTQANRVEIVRETCFPRLLVKLSYPAIFAQGLDFAVEIIESTFAQIEEAFPVSVRGRLELMELEEFITAYKSRQSMIVILTPITMLSVLFTAFATTLFLGGRKSELALLRSRGASFQQLYGTLLLEFTILAILGLILGNLLGIVIGCLLPSSTSFLQFDFRIFLQFLALANTSPIAWIAASCICIAPSLAYTIISTRSFLHTELYAAIRGGPSREWFSYRTQILYILGTCLLFLPLTIFVQTLRVAPDFSAAFGVGIFVMTVILWGLLCDVSARLIRPGVSGLSRIFRPLFGEKSTIFTKSVRTRRHRTIPLMMIMTLTFSVTIFSAVEAQTYDGYIQQQVKYFLGGDIRVYSQQVPASSVWQLLNIPGIDAATAVIVRGSFVASEEILLIGIDPVAYARTGNWDITSFAGADPYAVLNALENVPNAIIFPQHLANAMNRHVGAQIDVTTGFMTGFYTPTSHTKTFTIVGEVYSAPGFGFADPDGPAVIPTPYPGYGFQESSTFAFCHIDYFRYELPNLGAMGEIDDTFLFFANVEDGANQDLVFETVQALGFTRTAWSSNSLNIEEMYPGAYLFSSGVISLLSMSFLAALVLGLLSLTVFVNVMVSGRKTEYAIMRAIGGTRSQVTAIVVGEFAGLILVTFLLGLLLSVGFSWLLMNTLLKLFPLPTVVPFIILWPLLLLVGLVILVIIGMLIGIWLPARRAGAVTVNKILRDL